MKLKFINKLMQIKKEYQDYKERKYNKPIFIVEDYNDNSYENELNKEELKRLKYLLAKIIKKVSKKKNIRINTTTPFKEYAYTNPITERIFTNRDKDKITNYLENYFRFRNKFSQFSKTYSKLNQLIREIEHITDCNINSYDDLMEVGKEYYLYRDEEKFLQKVRNNQNMKERLKKYELLPQIEKVNEVPTVSKKKKEIIENDNTKDILSNKRKLLYRIRKFENLLTNEKDQNKVKFYKHEIYMLKLAIIEMENDLFNEKKNDSTFTDTINNSNSIRRNNALKTIEIYIRRYNNKRINCTALDYFGLDQIEYFKSLGIDIENMLEERLITKDKPKVLKLDYNKKKLNQ